MKYSCTKHDVEQPAYDLRVLSNRTNISKDYMLEHFSKAFPPAKEAWLPMINDVQIAMGKARVLLHQFKTQLP